MALRFITLGDGRRVTLGSYVGVVRAALANPSARFKRGIDDNWPATGAEIASDFRRGMVDRINQNIPYHKRGA